MGLATAAVMAASSMLVGMFRNRITQEVRIPVFILVIASMVTLVDLFMNAWMHELYKVLGMFIPLIVSNCLPLARLKPSPARTRSCPRWWTACSWAWLHHRAHRYRRRARGVGAGTLFADASLLLGPPSSSWKYACCPPTQAS